jgi:hypothetical protein
VRTSARRVSKPLPRQPDSRSAFLMRHIRSCRRAWPGPARIVWMESHLGQRNRT